MKTSRLIHTYHERISSDIHYNTRRQEMLKMWENSWRKAGWTPCIHSEEEVLVLPRCQVFDAIFMSFPTVNGRAYEVACWRRWLLAAQIGGAWTDYDNINTGITPSAFVEGLQSQPEATRYSYPRISFAAASGEPPNTGVMMGEPFAFVRALDRVASYDFYCEEINGQPHYSDMLFWQQLLDSNLKQNSRFFNRATSSPLLVRAFSTQELSNPTPGIVHCSNHHASKAGMTQFEAVTQLFSTIS